MGRQIVHLGGQEQADRRVARLVREFDLDLVDQDAAIAPMLVVVDVAGDEAPGTIAAVRRHWPDTTIAGYLAVPDHDRWLAAQRAGADVVTNLGALSHRLRDLLSGSRDGVRRWYPLLPSADVAGRLGLVARLDTEPFGPVAIYHVEGAVHVLADRCPHAGAALSEGELDGRVLTCPRHGSQFDVCTGVRLRGPADEPVRCLPVSTAGGQVSVDLASVK